MKLEDERLHETPKPWISTSKRQGLPMILFGAIFLTIMMILVVMMVGSEGSLYYVPFAILMPLVPCIIIWDGLRKLTDQKDRWSIFLPYNKLLYKMILKNCENIFQEQGYKYELNEKLTISDVIIWERDNTPVGKSYRISTGSDNHIDFEFAMTHTHTKNSNYYGVHLVINNINMENLDFAVEFQREIHNYLRKIEYRKFKEVLKVT